MREARNGANVIAIIEGWQAKPKRICEYRQLYVVHRRNCLFIQMKPEIYVSRSKTFQNFTRKLIFSLSKKRRKSSALWDLVSCAFSAKGKFFSQISQKCDFFSNLGMVISHRSESFGYVWGWIYRYFAFREWLRLPPQNRCQWRTTRNQYYCFKFNYVNANVRGSKCIIVRFIDWLSLLTLL